MSEVRSGIHNYSLEKGIFVLTNVSKVFAQCLKESIPKISSLKLSIYQKGQVRDLKIITKDYLILREKKTIRSNLLFPQQREPEILPTKHRSRATNYTLPRCGMKWKISCISRDRRRKLGQWRVDIEKGNEEQTKKRTKLGGWPIVEEEETSRRDPSNRRRRFASFAVAFLSSSSSSSSPIFESQMEQPLCSGQTTSCFLCQGYEVSVMEHRAWWLVFDEYPHPPTEDVDSSILRNYYSISTYLKLNGGREFQKLL